MIEKNFNGYDVAELFAEAAEAAETAEANNMELFITNSPITFTNVVAGEKCHNGGEYGFYTRYYPIAGFDGIYAVETITTCEFDNCGCGFEGIKPLTVAEYKRLREQSDIVEASGSQY